MDDIKREIIRKVMYKPGLRFNQLWDKKHPSNKFAYHLKVLEETGFIEKKDERYYLSHEGKRYVAFVDGESGKRVNAPLAAVAVVVVRDNKTILLQRRKEPFYRYWGFVGGKIEFNQYILEAAKKELKEETGLSADLSIRGLFCTKTYNNGKQSYNHQIFIVRGDSPRGNLIAKTREGIAKWVEIDKVKDMKTFPDCPKNLEIALQDKFTILEMDRYQENDEFREVRNVRKTVF